MGIIRKIGRKLLGRGERSESAASPPAASPSTSASPSGGEALKESLARLDCGAQELRERLDAGEEIVIVDVRDAPELAGGVLPGAVHIPLPELEARWTELEGADEVVCYCAVGRRSMMAAKLLRKKGLINATSLEDGIPGWQQAGGELVDP